LAASIQEPTHPAIRAEAAAGKAGTAGAAAAEIVVAEVVTAVAGEMAAAVIERILRRRQNGILICRNRLCLDSFQDAFWNHFKTRFFLLHPRAPSNIEGHSHHRLGLQH
jgi:hypothetical protein